MGGRDPSPPRTPPYRSPPPTRAGARRFLPERAEESAKMAIVDFYNLLEIGFLDLVLSRGGKIIVKLVLPAATNTVRYRYAGCYAFPQG